LKDLDRRIDLHSAFWKKENERPLVSLTVGKLFITDEFAASQKLLGDKREIRPDMLHIEEFLPDYERMYELSETVACKDAIWTAEPYAAIPWIEAMLGCKIFPGRSSFSSKPKYVKNPDRDMFLK
jgi:hypothetical protein